MTGKYSLRIRMGHAITHDSITFRLSDDLPYPGTALMQFELEVARIAAEDAIPLHREIARLRGLRVAAEMARRGGATPRPDPCGVFVASTDDFGRGRPATEAPDA